MESRPALPVLEEFCAWSRAELEETETWRAALSESEVLAWAENLRGPSRSHTDVAPILAGDALPSSLRGRLSDLSDALVFGRGFFVLRRLPLERLSQAEAALLFRSLAAPFGRLEAAPREEARASCDSYLFVPTVSDVLAQVCVRASAAGGELRLISAVALHNEMVRCRPDLLPYFYEPIGKARALFCAHGERLVAHVDPRFARLAAASAAASLSTDQRQAFALFEALVEELAFDIDFEPGDALFANSRHVLVAQGPHVNYAELGKSHALMRLWLSNPRLDAHVTAERGKSARARAAA